MSLRDEVAGRSRGDAILAVLRKWYGLDVGPVEPRLDEDGIPTLLHALKASAPLLPRQLERAFRQSGEVDGSKVIVVIEGSGPVWALPGEADPELMLETRARGREVPAERMEQYLLNTLLHLTLGVAPVAGDGFWNDTRDIEEWLDTLEPLGTDTNTRLDMTAFRYFAAGDAIVRAVSRARVQVAARSREGIEAVRPPCDRWEWTRLDRIGPPDEDQLVGASYRVVEFNEANRSGESLVDALSDPDPVGAVDRFVHAWYGLRLPEVPGGGGPPFLRRLQALNADQPVIGAHDQLLRPDEERDTEHGVRWFYAENQGVWGAGYLGDEDNPDVWWDLFDETGGQPLRFSGFKLDEFLLARVLAEAIHGAPVMAMTTVDFNLPALDAALESFTPVVSAGTTTTRTDGRILLVASRTSRQASLHVGAHERNHIVDSALASLGGWGWFYGDRPAPDEGLASWFKRPRTTS